MSARYRFRAVSKGVLVTLVLGVIAGCASDPRYRQGVEWVQWQEAERQRLQAAGFPQYNHD